MTIWELMTEEVQKKFEKERSNYRSLFKQEDKKLKTIEDLDKYLDEFKCFQFDDFICKTENRKIVKMYYIYELCATQPFGDNNELLLMVGHEEAAVINRNTLDVVTHTYTR